MIIWVVVDQLECCFYSSFFGYKMLFLP